MTKLTDETKEEIVRLVHNGHKMTNVARTFGVTVGRVSQIVKEHYKSGSSAPEPEVEVDYNGNVIPIKKKYISAKVVKAAMLSTAEMDELAKKLAKTTEMLEEFDKASVKVEGGKIKYGEW